MAFREVDLAELRDLLAELPIPLLRPRGKERRPLEVRPSSADRVGRQLNDPPEGRPADGHERVAEVERDRGDPRELPGHVATLDGQMVLNGQ